MPDEPDPPRKIYQLGKAQFERVNAPAGSPEAATPEQDVHAILHGNLTRANDAGLNEVAYRERRPSRRKRDYWVLMLAGNAFFGLGIAIFGLKTLAGICAFAGIIILSVSLTWVMWFIMDDY